MPPISFPVKLWNTLNSGPSDLIRWSGDGTEVYVNEGRFEELIEQYPSFLRQPTLSSLRRLFAVYEFHREDLDGLRTGWSCYSHPYFVRGQTNLLELFVLSHQTRRFNMKKAKSDDDDDCEPRKRRKRAENVTNSFVAESDSKYDLRPIRSSSLFRCTFCACLDEEFDGSSPEESPFTHLREPEAYHIADCSSITETDIEDSDVSFCPQEVVHGISERWMCEINENDEWFGMNYQPVAVPVSSDFQQHETVDNAVPNYANLLQLQHHDGM